LNKITNLKSASKGVNQKNKFAEDNLKKIKNYRGKAKLTYFAGDKDLLTLILIMWLINAYFFWHIMWLQACMLLEQLN
jgi:hypothetical protein